MTTNTRVIEIATREVGVQEEPTGSNRGRRVEEYQRSTTLPGSGCQCERVQRLRQEVNDVIRTNRRIAAAGQRQTPPASPLSNEFRRLLAQLEVQAATDCRAVVPGPTVIQVD